MWLLDANMDVHLVDILTDLGIVCDTAARRNWKALSHGQLVSAAVASGSTCLLTRDTLFGQAASRALKPHAAFAVVVVTLPQARWSEYLKSFLRAWGLPDSATAGQIIAWLRLGALER